MKNKLVFGSLEKKILDDLVSHHAKVYLVGGIVRDLLVFNKADYHDVDVEIYHLDIDEVEKILSQYGHVNHIGKSFGILKLDVLPHFDFALPRKEIKTGKKHQDFTMMIDKDMDLKEACMRRDLTMNALMYDYSTGEIYDFFDGINDIRQQTIKMIEEKTFVEDPLRVLRVAQFASRLEFHVDHHTQQVCQNMVAKGQLNALSYERIIEEYNKILLSNKPSIGIQFLLQINALFEPLMVLKDCQQRRDFHPEGNVMNHTLLVIDLAALCKQGTSYPLAFMWSALLHDIGKPAVTTADGRAPGHNESGVRVFREYFSSRIQDKRLKKYIETMIFYHMHLMNMVRNNSRDYSYYKLLKGIDNIMPLDDLVLMTKCDKLGRYYNRPEPIHDLDCYIQEHVSRLGSKALKPVVTGQDLIDLHMTNGPQFKELLDWAYDLQMRGHDKNDIMHLIKEKL